MQKEMTHWMEDDHPAEDPFEADLQVLLRVCRKIRDGCHSVVTIDELADAIELVELHFEDDDPRAMGWVGDDGLP